MTDVVNTELGATGNYINFGADPTNNDNLGAQTIIAYCKPTATGGGGFGYIFGKTPSGSTAGPRFYIDHNSGNPRIVFAAHSALSGCPSRAGADNSVVYGNWQYFTADWNGGIGATTGTTLYVNNVQTTSSANTDGSGSVVSDTANEMFLFNRGNSGTLGRAFVGSGAWVARWNRVLNSTERGTAHTNGPLDPSLASGLVLCWANGQDYSPSALTPIARSTHADGDMPSTVALGDGDVEEPTTATLTGPTGGTTGSNSANFTVTLDEVATEDVEITPAESGPGSVTFSPSLPVIEIGETAVTFTANADTDGTHVITITNDQSLSNVGSINYTTNNLTGGGGGGLLLGGGRLIM